MYVIIADKSLQPVMYAFRVLNYFASLGESSRVSSVLPLLSPRIKGILVSGHSVTAHINNVLLL